MKLHVSPQLALPEESITETFAILAMRGVGKTYTANVHCEEMLKASAHVCVLDPTGAWWGLRASADGKSEGGFPVIIMGGDHGDVPLESAAGEVIANFVVDQDANVVLDLSLFRKNEQTRFVTDFLETLYRRNRQAIHVFLDEADAFAPQRPLHGQERMLGAVEDIVRRGRIKGIGVTLITQRSAVLNKNVLTQTSVLVAMRTISPQDRDAIEDWIKAHDVADKRDTMMDSLASLPIGTAWYWSPGWLDLFRRVKVRERETFNSSATPKPGEIRRTPKKLAKVDLEALTKSIASTIEKAKQEDPRELRKRIAQLEAEVRKKPIPAAPPAPDPQRVVKLREQLESMELRFRAANKEVSMLSKELQRIRSHHEKLKSQFARSVDGMRASIDDLFPADLKIETIDRVVKDVPHAQVQPVSPIRVTLRDQADRVVHEMKPGELIGIDRDPPELDADDSLPVGEKRVLTAIAQHPEGVDRDQLSVLTGYKRATRNTYILRLATRGFVTVEDGRVRPTDVGVAQLGADFQPLPTGAALREHWLTTLPEGERKILQVLLQIWPQSIARDALTELTGYKRATRNTYLLRLHARRIITLNPDGPSTVKASDQLWV